MSNRHVEPEFYLASSEGYGFDQPRACYPIKKLKGRAGDDYLLIRVDPTITGQPYGLGAREISYLVVATRHVGTSLFPITDWPVSVHVVRPLVADIERREQISETDLEEIGWAELYADLESAEEKSR